jgi:CRP/FNR family cyclic AMP-dependent transcriptional regulator
MDAVRTESPGYSETLSLVQRQLIPHGRACELLGSERLASETVRDHCGFILCGQLRRVWNEGDEVVDCGVLRIGDWINAHAFLLGDALKTVTYRATTFTRVLLLGIDTLKRKLGEELAGLKAPLHESLAVDLARRQLELSRRLHQCYFADTESLVLDALHEARSWPSAMSHPEGTLVKVPGKALAERVGCTRVTVSRVLGKLIRDGRVRREGRRILLLDQPQGVGV